MTPQPSSTSPWSTCSIRETPATATRPGESSETFERKRRVKPFETITKSFTGLKTCISRSPETLSRRKFLKRFTRLILFQQFQVWYWFADLTNSLAEKTLKLPKKYRLLAQESPSASGWTTAVSSFMAGNWHANQWFLAFLILARVKYFEVNANYKEYVLQYQLKLK